MRLLILLLVPMLLLGCGPKPPETMLAGYYTELLLKQDHAAALENCQYPAGITPPEDTTICFPEEAPLVQAVRATFERAGATELMGRRKIWGKLQREGLIKIEREHTTRTTATTRVRMDIQLARDAGLENPQTLELNYVMLRGADKVWRLNRVEIADWKRGGEYGENEPPPPNEN